MHKKRGYKRENPIPLVRDYRLFAIACEGSKTEPNYFNLFSYISNKIAVDIIEEIIPDNELETKKSLKSSPKWVLDRAIKYIEKEGLSEDDSLWFVMDIDRWNIDQIREIALYCEQKPNWHIVLSNPCFEVWLYFHNKATVLNDNLKSCQNFKNEIASHVNGGYSPKKFIKDIEKAIKNSKEADLRKDHFLPDKNTTKVYLLAEALINLIGKNKFEKFLKNTLPNI